MSRQRLILLIFIVLLTKVSSMPAYGQYDGEKTVRFRLIETQIDTVYLSNRQNLKLIEELFAGRSIRIDSVTIAAWSSPEGSPSLNASLAERRATSLEEFILQAADGTLNRSHIRTTHVAENWEGLLQSVREHYFRHDRDKVISILADRSIGDETRKWRLKQLDGGYTWNFLYRRYMPALRQAVITGIAYRPYATLSACLLAENLPVAAQPLPRNVSGPILPYEADRQETAAGGSFVFALKTNLLYDAALVPNVGVEFHLGKGWAATAGWNYAWWDNDASHRYWRIYGGEAEVRKYFGAKAKECALSGHHIGVYGQGFTYDFELGGRGQISDMSYGGGISYGYALPLGRSFNLDFCIGFGYLGGEYKVYDPEDGCYVWKETRQRHFMGPTKAEVALVWVIGRKGPQWEKGGRK